MASRLEIVPTSFFSRHAREVAPDLLGRHLLVWPHTGGEPTRARIIETEAYGGPEDPASHAAFRPGGRARVMWDEAGTIYVYAAYGMYPCLNIVTGVSGEAGAVLIRGVWIEGDSAAVSGPGRTSIALGVSLDDHGACCDGTRFAVSAERVEAAIEQTVRVGISRGVEIPWRYVVRPDCT